MAYDTDEEQIEALKAWWDENGKLVIVGIVLVLAVLFGSRYWQSSQAEYAEAASDIYGEMLANVNADIDGEVDDQDLAMAEQFHASLKDNFEASIYSRYSALLIAKLYVERKDFDAASEELQWVLDTPSLGFLSSVDEGLSLTARARLARVVLASGEAETALSLLNEVEASNFEGVFAEIQGDANVVLGRLEEARAAYQTALNMGVNTQAVQLKLDDISS